MRHQRQRVWTALAAAVLLLSACSSTMPTKASGFLGSYNRLTLSSDGSMRMLRTPEALDPAHTVITTVEWRVTSANNLSPEERARLLNKLRAGLQAQVNRLPATAEGRPAEIRAAITDIATVSPSLNVLSVAMFAAPLDRGGASVEIEALDTGTRQQLAAMTMGYFAPISELKARFSALAPASIALDKASAQFGPLLRTDN
ncbi:DUF3313 family protein [Acerihabitans arboris]|uniref:DUF3313 family protein n=1 Tax=Acerihabitans arboris TaxID=2691583 RepID=A0A845ST14_9GAMM|nr:DUF3313 family protein [Acerihabitans arboris]NDL65641.1 DUF3313 family protein [Acerihabitans arboris]